MLISVIGNRGDGKTTLLTYFAKKLVNSKIYSNYKLKLKNYHKLELETLLKLPNDITIFLDEGYTWLESRTSMSALNRYISYIVFQSRKRTIDILITAQLFSTVDIRFREQSDIIVYCKRMKEAFRYLFVFCDSNKYLNLYLPFDYCKKYIFDIFDTNEIIEPNDISTLEFKIKEKNPKKLAIKIKEIAIDIKPKISKHITHDSVKVALLLNGYHIGYEKYVYLYLKEVLK